MHNVALGGCLAAFLLLALSALGQESESNSVPQAQSDETKRNAAESQFRPTTPDDQERAAIEADARRKAEQAAQDDLLAQQSMARSTKDLVDLTGTQITLSLVESALLIATTALTALAAYAAVVAARASRDSVRVSEQSRADTDRHIMQQLRAYVGVAAIDYEMPAFKTVDYKPTDMSVPEFNINDFVVLTVTNSGQTPANNLWIWIRYLPWELGVALPSNYPLVEPDLEKITPYNNPAIKRTLRPGESYSSRNPIFDATAHIAAHKNKAHMFIYGQIHYTDVFEVDQTTDFGFRYEPRLPQGHRFTAIRHNEAT